MKGYLLDTNIISEYSHVKPPGERVRKWIDAQDESSLYLSVLTLGEIRKGTTLLPPSNKRTQLEAWLQTGLPSRFGDRLLPISAEIAELWGTMAGQARLKGITLAIIDGLLAATAIYHDLKIVSRNVKDFNFWKVPVINPWDD